jgi:hypothetical protein
MNITVHKLYYGPIGENGLTLKASPELRDGKVLNDDAITDIYTMQGKRNQTINSSELIYTPNGPVIRVTRIQPIQGHDKRTSQSCNKSLFIKLSDISNILLPLLDEELIFPLQETTLKVEVEPQRRLECNVTENQLP